MLLYTELTWGLLLSTLGSSIDRLHYPPARAQGTSPLWKNCWLHLQTQLWVTGEKSSMTHIRRGSQDSEPSTAAPEGWSRARNSWILLSILLEREEKLSEIFWPASVSCMFHVLIVWLKTQSINLPRKRKQSVWKTLKQMPRKILYVYLYVCVHAHTRAHMHTQSCLTLNDHMDCSLPGSSVHGVLQARILEWVVIAFSRGSSQPRDWSQISCVSYIGRQILYHNTHICISLMDRNKKAKKGWVLT